MPYKILSVSDPNLIGNNDLVNQVFSTHYWEYKISLYEQDNYRLRLSS